MRTQQGPRPVTLPLTDRQRAILEELVHRRRRPHDEVQRAAIILQSAGEARTRQLAMALGVSDPTVRLWRTRWAHATPQVAAAQAEADEETLRGLIQQVLRETPPWTACHGYPGPAVPDRGRRL